MIGRLHIVAGGLALLALGGCQEPPPAAKPGGTATATAGQQAAPAQASGDAPVGTPDQPPTTVNGTAAPSEPVDPAHVAARQAQVHAMQAGVRQTHFESQLAVPLPADAPAEVGRLVPPSAKLVEFEISHRMQRLAPAEGQRVVLRWLTRLEGQLAQALARRAVAQWLGEMPPEGASMVEHPRFGTLRWTMHSPDERATRIEMVLDGPAVEGASPWPALEGAPWLAALDGAQLSGYERGRYHARRGPETYTDLERISAIVPTADGPGLQRRLEQACLAAGYKVDDDDPRLLRGPGTARTTFTTRIEEGRLTLHHQRRWRRVAPTAAEAPKKAP